MLDIALALVIYTIVFQIGRRVFDMFGVSTILQKLGMGFMGLPKWAMMLLMAIPEQLIMARFAPRMPLAKRLSVSAAMYAIHFAWNGLVMKTPRAYNELAWILGTALFARNVLGVNMGTATALVAADSVMTLAMRDLV